MRRLNRNTLIWLWAAAAVIALGLYLLHVGAFGR